MERQRLGTSPVLYLAGIYLAIAIVTGLHYATDEHAHHLHDIYRRLYYLPIILAAFLHGFRGGLVAALIVCLAYAPHALGHISHDPASDTQKALEMLLYLAVGSTTGILVSRLKGAQRALETTASNLQESLRQLREAEERLLQNARLAAVGRLSAGLAHEIRNPLASIKGSAEILADDFPPEHPKRRLLRVLVDESARLNHVLTRFLAFARPQPLDREEFDLAAEVEAVVTLVQTQEDGRSVRIRLERDPGGTWIRGDRAQIRQVLLNVLLNACQAAGPDGEVGISYSLAPDRCVRIAVTDSGPGFTPEAVENAFTPFFTTRERGTGLGLAISHRILEAHGGRVRIDTAPGGGGRVELELPTGRS